ncbi:MAG: hypothetical protein KKA79_05260 [Nanoarchaeota archaeon]|nr:hypothetical protein [Nanoarchaeota archaeon]MCG2717891.1 hypothetical protein [Nanoarchaeota archaeon]
MNIPEEFKKILDKYDMAEVPEDIKDDVGSIIESFNEEVDGLTESYIEDLEGILESYQEEQEEMEECEEPQPDGMSVDEYREFVQKRMEGTIDAPENTLAGLKKWAIITSLATLATVSINTLCHDGPTYATYLHEVKNNAQVTGIGSYAVYRRIENKDMAEEGFSLVGRDADIITKGSYLFRHENFIDYNRDGIVERIQTNGFSRKEGDNNLLSYIVENVMGEKKNIWRAESYQDNKELFDDADKYFQKYIKKLKK